MNASVTGLYVFLMIEVLLAYIYIYLMNASVTGLYIYIYIF